MIEIRISAGRGRGVFASEDISAGYLIEEAPVIVLPAQDRPLLDQTLLHDYIFEWGEDGTGCAVALGYISIYNHAHPSNCEYELDYDSSTIRVRTIREIRAGEELVVNYNGDFDNSSPVWFVRK